MLSLNSFAFSNITLISPVNNTFTTNETLMINFSSLSEIGNYSLILADSYQMNNILNTLNNNLTHFNLEGLTIGKYYFRIIDKTQGNSWLYSEVYMFTILKKPSGFSIDVNLDEYSSNQFVHLYINASLNSSVKLKIDGPGDSIEYNPENLQNPNWYARLEDPGVYILTSSMKYFDFYDEFTTTFELEGDYINDPNPQINSTNQSTNNTNNSELVTIKLNILDSNSKAYTPLLDAKLIVTFPNDTKTNLYSNKDGVISFTGEVGEYSLLIQKEDYIDEVLELTILENFSLDVLLKTKSPKTYSALSSASGSDERTIRISHPSNNTYFTGSDESIEIDYTIHPDANLECQLFFREKSGSGWSIIGKDEKSIYDINVKEKGYVLNNLEQGTYTFLVKCQDQKLILSETITFHVKRPTLDIENIGATEKLRIKELNNQIKSVSSDIVLALETLKITDTINHINSQIDNYNSEIREKTKELEEISEIETIIKSYTQKLDSLKNDLPVSMSVRDESTIIKYLPGDGLDNMISELKKSSSKSVVDYISNKKNTELFQKNYYQNIKIKKIELTYPENKKKVYTLVKKEIHLLEPENSGDDSSSKNGSIIIFEKINANIKGSDLTFLSPVENIKSEIYKLSTPEQRNYAYIISGDIDKSVLKSAETLILPADFTSDINLITGLTFFSGTGIGSMITYFVSFILIFSVFGVLITRFANRYGGRINIPIIAKNHKSDIIKLLNKTFSHIESGDLKNVELLLSKVLKKYPNLSMNQKEELDPIIKSAFDFVDIYHLKENINQITNVINLQNHLNKFDNHLFSKSITLYQTIQNHYNKLDNNYKFEYQSQINNIHNNLVSIKEKYIKN